MWKLSREVDPLAHLYTGRITPPFFKVPVCVYRCTPSGSWMHGMCCCCTRHTSAILSLSNKGTPNVSQPLGPSRDCIRPDTRFCVSCVPLVTCLQWSASSAEVRCRLTLRIDTGNCTAIRMFKTWHMLTRHCGSKNITFYFMSVIQFMAEVYLL